MKYQIGPGSDEILESHRERTWEGEPEKPDKKVEQHIPDDFSSLSTTGGRGVHAAFCATDQTQKCTQQGISFCRRCHLAHLISNPLP